MAPETRPAAVFFFLASLLFGAAFTILTPPFQAPDEYVHFLRAVDVSGGNLTQTAIERRKGVEYRWPVGANPADPEHQRTVQRLVGGWMPPGVADLATTAFANLPFRPDRRATWTELRRWLADPTRNGPPEFVPFPATAAYPPWAYFPAAAGIRVAAAIGARPLVFLYAGRFASLAFFVLLVAAALRLLPAGRWILAAAALTPLALFMGSSISPDPVLFGIAALFFAMVLRARADPRPTLPKGRLAALLVLSVLVSLTKVAYAPLLLFVLLTPAAKLGGKMRAAAFLAVLLLVNVAAFALWSRLSGGLFVETRAPVDAAAQLSGYVLGRPLHFLSVLFRQAVENGPRTLVRSIGTLGWLDTRIPYALVATHAAALLLAASATALPGHPLSRMNRALLFLLPLAIWMLMALASFLLETPVGAARIVPVQGRYLLPAFFPFLLALTPPHPWPSPRATNVLLPLLLLTVDAGTLLALLDRYWGITPLGLLMPR